MKIQITKTVFCRESDYESNKSIEYMREEKKRKQMEAVAEDLFNNEKVSF